MASARIPASSNIVFQYWKSVLLIKRSSKAKAWPNFWAFPWWKVDNDEFFTETAQREIFEEIGISFSRKNISKETIIMHRSVVGTKIIYFGLVKDWAGIPEILEKNLASDIAWFPLDWLPEPIIPHHKEALDCLKNNITYHEFNTAP